MIVPCLDKNTIVLFPKSQIFYIKPNDKIYSCTIQQLTIEHKPIVSQVKFDCTSDEISSYIHYPPYATIRLNGSCGDSNIYVTVITPANEEDESWKKLIMSYAQSIKINSKNIIVDEIYVFPFNRENYELVQNNNESGIVLNLISDIDWSYNVI